MLLGRSWHVKYLKWSVQWLRFIYRDKRIPLYYSFWGITIPMYFNDYTQSEMHWNLCISLRCIKKYLLYSIWCANNLSFIYRDIQKYYATVMPMKNNCRNWIFIFAARFETRLFFAYHLLWKDPFDIYGSRQKIAS